MTFSIVARSKKGGEFGVASSTAAPCVGAMLPYAEEGVGAVATQAWVNVNLGYQGLALMRHGLSVKSAINALLDEDPGRARRQVIAIDSKSIFGYTGVGCTEAKGHIIGEDFAVAGNILADKRVLEAMVDSFKKSRGEFTARLLSALEAGQAAGGDSRGKISSTVLVASPTPRLYHNIRVDFSDDPIKVLKGIYDKCVKLEEEFGDDDGEELRFRTVRVQR